MSRDGEAVGADAYRAVMRRFPTGVTIVTTALEGTPKGFTANAVASVSVDPPMVLVCVSRQARSRPIISRAGRFCVNLLTVTQQDLARRFAAKADDAFAEVRYRPDRTGSPVIEGALAYLDCDLAAEYTAGTHTIFIGTVVACGSHDGAPLGYFNAAYRDFGVRVP